MTHGAETIATTYGALPNSHDEQLSLASANFDVALAKYNAFSTEAEALIIGAHVLATSWDIDGVLVTKYDERGNPIFDEKALLRLPAHIRRLDAACQTHGVRQVQLLNTNREVSIVPEIMKYLDPEDTQTTWGASLEGGHVIAYRHKFDGAQIQQKEDGEYVELPDGSLAQVVQRFVDGSRLVAEDLLAENGLHEMRIGTDELTVRDARFQLHLLFQELLGSGAFGTDAWMPKGRMGMVTARRVHQSAVQNGSDLSGLKKHHVQEGSMVMNEVRRILHLNGDDANLPFKLFYYPFDGGLDIEFGLNKMHGQQALFRCFRQLRIIGENERVVVAHLGDSGSDRISSRDVEGVDTAVIAVGNADETLVEVAEAQATRPAQRGAREIMYNLTSMVKRFGKKKLEENEQIHPRKLADFVQSYLGRTPTYEGDIDVLEVLRRADHEQLTLMRNEILRVQEQGGGVFLYGNGGSFDNARLIAHLLSEAGIDAQTPGDTKGYKNSTRRRGYEHIFVDALEAENFSPNDIAIGISGSGNSPNVLLAHEHAQRIRMIQHQAIIETLQTGGYSIDTSLLDNPSLREGNTNVASVAHGIAQYESSLQKASELARQKNDSDSETAIENLLANRTVMSLGGRDGGKMRLLTGAELTHIAPTPCMEALEDEHPLAMAAIAESIRSGKSVQESLAQVGTIIESMRQPETLEKIIRFAESMEAAILNGGRVIIVGNPDLNASVTHADADWKRGIINMLSISGPEVTLVDANVNAMMATGNDDGAGFVYADNLSKIQLGKNDIVVFIGPSHEEAAFEPCLEMATEAGTQTFVVGTDIGTRQADVSQPDEYVDLAATAITHTISRAVNEHIRSPQGLDWHVNPLAITSSALSEWIKQQMGSQRKLDKKATLQLEHALRNGGQLELADGTLIQVDKDAVMDGNVITWCYGQAYLARDPQDFSLDRGYY